MTKFIMVSDVDVAVVDDDDYEKLSQWNWQLNSLGYAFRAIRTEGKVTMIFMHREIIDPPVGYEVDHLSRNKLDNRRCNLRICTHSQNLANRSPFKPEIKLSKYKGVTFVPGRNRPWKTQIMQDHKRIFIGYFPTQEEGARAYDAKAKELFGEFAYTNFG